MPFWFKHLSPIYTTSQFAFSQFTYADNEYYFFYFCISISTASTYKPYEQAVIGMITPNLYELLTYTLTPRSRVLEKLTGSQLV